MAVKGDNGARMVLRKSLSYRAIVRLATFSLFFTTFIVYIPALWNGFINWDDDAYVYENPYIKSFDFNFIKWTFSSVYFNNWHPLTMISYALDYAVWGLNPFGYHLTNVILHALNTSLVFVLAVRLIERGIMLPTPNSRLRPIIAAFITALLFGVHPLHVESVAWISERKDVISSFFFLSSLLAYLKYTSSVDSQKRLFYCLCLISFTFALMSKPMAVTLPLVLLILDSCPLKGIRTSSVLLEKVPFLFLGIVSSMITIWAQYTGGALQTFETHPFTDRVFIAIKAYAFYLAKMVMPTNLAPFYPYPNRITFFSLEFLGSSILLITFTLLAALSLKRNRLFFAIWSYYVVTLIPVIGIIQVGKHAAADRYTYLPSIGPFLLAGVGFSLLLERYSKKIFAIVIALLLIAGILINKTWNQMAVWHDSITLWSHQIKLFPETTIAYHNIGNAYRDKGNYQQAIMNYNRAIELDPQYADAYTGRGVVSAATGNYRQAIMDYSTAIELNPQNVIALNNRGIAYGSLGGPQQALRDFSRAVELNDKYAEAYNNKGIAYSSLGNYKLAIIEYERAIELNPQFAEAYYNSGTAYFQSGEAELSLIYYKKAASLGSKLAQDYLDKSGIPWEPNLK